MFLNKMIAKKKILILPIIIAVLVVGVVVFQPSTSFAARATINVKAANRTAGKTQPIKVVGMAKFVLKGTVTAVSVNALTLHIANTSKNAKLFDNKDKTLIISSKTALTKNGKNIPLAQIKMGSKVKVFGIFDKKTGNITLVRWVKVVAK